jgi:hypothetical protein
MTTQPWRLAPLLLSLAACGGAELHGRLDRSTLTAEVTTAVAVDADGRLAEAALGDDGRFALLLGGRGPHAVAFRDRHGRAVAHLVVGEDRRPELDAIGRVDLGVVRPDDRGAGTEPGDDRGAGTEPGDDHGRHQRRGCRAVVDGATVRVESELVRGADDSLASSGDRLPDRDDDRRPDGLDDDPDGDGVCGDDDATSGDAGPAGDDHGGRRAELPYAVELEEGGSFALRDAFRADRPAPVEILEVSMDEGSHRLDALRSGVSFVVTAEDCAHEGNRGRGRDRIFVTWRNPDGSLDLDHLDLRYCGR